MSKSEVRKSYTFDRPGNYRIRVQGTLNESWSERLGGMYIATNSRGDQKKESTLVGLMRDQAELSGVLNSLYDLHQSIPKVEVVNGE